jgi:hypothetical protein
LKFDEEIMKNYLTLTFAVPIVAFGCFAEGKGGGKGIPLVPPIIIIGRGVVGKGGYNNGIGTGGCWNNCACGVWKLFLWTDGGGGGG